MIADGDEPNVKKYKAMSCSSYAGIKNLHSHSPSRSHDHDRKGGFQTALIRNDTNLDKGCNIASLVLVGRLKGHTIPHVSIRLFVA